MAVDTFTFEGFGDSILAPAFRRPLRQIALSADLQLCRRQLQEHAPNSPGVYGWLDKNQRLMYVGKSKSLRARLSSYFAPEPEDAKVIRLRRSSTRLIWEPITHDLLALIREQELIYRWRPSFNRQGQPHRRRPGYICLTQGLAPKVIASDQPVADAAASYGPILGTGELRDAVQALNYVFGLRDCSDQVRIQLTPQLTLLEDVRHAQCVRHELGSCLGPCTGSCSPRAYRDATTAAQEFLNGSSAAVLKRLKGEMIDAAERLAFEKAIVVQNQIKSLKWLSNKLKQWRHMREKIDGAYPVPTFSREPLWLVFQAGSLAGYSNDPAARRWIRPAALKRMEKCDHLLEIAVFLIISSWFRKNPDQQERLVQRQPDAPPARRTRSRETA